MMNVWLSNSTILGIIRSCNELNIGLYGYGDIVFNITKNTNIPIKTLKLILTKNIEVHKFYQTLSKHITINQELLNNKHKYIIESEPYIVDFSIINSIDDFNIQSQSVLTIDHVVYDFIKNETIYYNNKEDFFNNVIKSVYDQLEDKDVLYIATKYANIPNSKLDDTVKEKLKQKELSFNIKKALYCNKPGTAIKFLLENIKNGKEKMSSCLLDLAIELDIPLNTDFTVSESTSEKTLELIDIYNEFYLHDKIIEDAEDLKKRTASTLRLMFNSPSLNSSLPFIESIDEIQSFSHSMVAMQSGNGACCLQGGVCIETTLSDCTRRLGTFKGESTTCTHGLCDEFGPGDCAYPPCPKCNPSECGSRDGVPCCCCSSIDIIYSNRIQCHQKVIASCNNSGTSPGPGLDDFHEDCDKCRETCESVLGAHSSWDICNNTGFPSWWQISPLTPCECHSSTVNGEPIHCVTCLGENGMCDSVMSVSGTDCFYEFSISPSSGCCGSPSYVDLMFVIDYSDSMSSKINEIKNQVLSLVDLLNETGAIARIGLVSFGNSSSPELTIPFTNPTAFKDQMPTETNDGSSQHDFEAVYSAIVNGNFSSGNKKFIMLIADELSYGGYGDGSSAFPWYCELTPGLPPNYITNSGFTCGDSNLECFNRVVDLCNLKQIEVIVVDTTMGSSYDANISDCGDPARLSLSNATGGKRYSFDTDFNEIIQDINLTTLPTSCDCVDNRPIKIRKNPAAYPECDCPTDPTGIECQDSIPDWCYQFPIHKRLVGQTQNNCGEPITINVCGSTIIIVPDKVNEVCCGSLTLSDGTSLGCECPSIEEPGCCGPQCVNICKPNGNGSFYTTLIDAKNAVWENCIQQQAYSDPEDPDCLWFTDGDGGFIKKCRSQSDQETESIYQNCFILTPEVAWTCDDTECDRTDECIVGSPTGILFQDQCGNSHKGCSTVKNPSVVVLNNGVGLVAYESIDYNDDSVSKIRIQQFLTSSKHKILSNRVFNFGRLQHPSKWQSNVAKLYVYDEVPVPLIQGDGSATQSDTTTWKDAIVFENGPFKRQCFPLSSPSYGIDDIGPFIAFHAPSDSPEFSSSDDIYNIKWFIFDVQSEDKLIGESIGDNNQTYPFGQFLFTNRQEVDNQLYDLKHIYNGQPVPQAFPSISTSYNYSNALENSHFVYLTYQSLEDDKWNIYLKQIRISEYSKAKQLSTAQVSALSTLNVSELIYQVYCMADICSSIGNNLFLTERTVIFELLLDNGLEVLNSTHANNQYWNSLCPGYKSTSFPKRKCFAKLVHSVVCNKCPDQFERNDIFNNWKVGQQFNIPLSVSSPQSLYILVKIPTESPISIGQFDSPVIQGNVQIFVSTISGQWYDFPSNSPWAVISDTGSVPTNQDILTQFKGMDFSEPILISSNESKHNTRSVVKASYSNDIFVVYESIDSNGIPQIKVKGTKEPVSTLPVGISNPRNLDSNFNYFFNDSDFVYQKIVTTDGVNQSPDAYIDLNDVVHITWQSNKDGQWEIYYANSEDDFEIVRITKSEGKSLQPSIHGSDDGNVYITWHDDRFGNYEIMLAYCLKERILPLLEQDPYLASMRNFENGWNHYIDRVDFSLTNQTSDTQCLTDIRVNFYENRVLENQSFSISSKQYPFAFHLNDIEVDSTTINLDDINDWNQAYTYDTYPVFVKTTVATSPEIDSFLPDSLFGPFTLPSLSDSCSLESISFRSSNTKNGNSQWTDFVSIIGQEGNTLNLSDLGVEELYGRYKQFRIKFYCNGISESFEIMSGYDDADTEDNVVWNNERSIVKFGEVQESGNPTYEAFLRFLIDIPKDVEIVHSDVLFQSADNQSGSIVSNICLLDSSNASPFSHTLTEITAVDSSASDIHIKNGDTTIESTYTSRTMLFGRDSTDTYDSWLRFPLDIPKNSIISNAYIEFTSASDSSGNSDLLIYLLDSKNAREFITTAYETIFESEQSDLAGGQFSGNAFSNFVVLPTPRSLFPLDIVKISPDTTRDVFVRWNLSSLPPNAVITNAYITVDFIRVASGNPPIYIANPVIVNQGNNCPEWEESLWEYPLPAGTSFNPFAPSNLDGLNKIEWTPGGTGERTSPDISSLIQTWIDNGGITNGQGFYGVAISDNTYGTSHVGYRINGEPSYSISLSVTYISNPFPTLANDPVRWEDSLEWIGGEQYETVNLNTLITSWLSLQDSDYVSGNYIGFKIAENVSNTIRQAYTFDSSGLEAILHVEYQLPVPECSEISARWEVDNWTEDEHYLSPNINQLVQTFIDDSNYNLTSNPFGQYIGLKIGVEETNGIRNFVSYDGGNSAVLNVYYIEPFSWSFSAESISPKKICLTPGQSATGYFTLTPLARIDKYGQETEETILPVQLNKNQTYFIEILGINETDNTIVTYQNQRSSVSCFSCFREPKTWESTSCSVLIQIDNTTEADVYYQLRLTFYSDQQLLSRVTEIRTDINTDCFSAVSADKNASLVWTEKGYKIKKGQRLDVLAWPQISNSVGLVCGITYYIQIEYCQTEENEPNCQLNEYVLFGNRQWVCNCNSVRQIDESYPINLINKYRWASSGFGFSDTRITETNSDNTNPIIKIRDDKQGVIIYETNRNKPETKILASVFSIKPSFNMFASGSEFINSPFDSVIHKNDIEICKNQGCYQRDEEGNLTSNIINEPLIGQKPIFDLDRYDNLFLSLEQTFSSNNCSNFGINKQNSIVVHRCGANSKDLNFTIQKQQDEDQSEICKPTAILETLYSISDPLFSQIVKKIQVQKQYVEYNVVYNNINMSVVNTCDIKLEIIGQPESIALRLRNGKTEDWSEWISYSKQTGENEIIIDWKLTNGSGIKNVYFQVATYAGMTAESAISILADYQKINYTINIYQWESAPFPPDSLEDEFESNNNIWSETNKIIEFYTIPVASIRNKSYNSDYLFIEIIPDQKYMEQFKHISVPEKKSGLNVCISPTIDFLTQGNDIYGVKTKWAINSFGTEVFRTFVNINKEDNVSFKDGLSTIIPHFKNDCSEQQENSVICPKEFIEFEKDKFNTFIKPLENNNTATNYDRDELGFIKHKTNLGPEDPYLIFGDPDYFNN